MPIDKNTFNRVRVAGSGFTVFHFNGNALAFCKQVAHTSPSPVAQPVPIQPMDSRYPLQIITPAAAGMGTVVLDMYELYGQQVWERLGTRDATLTGATDSATSIFDGAIDIVDVFVRQAAAANPIQVIKYINPPQLRAKKLQSYTEEYHNVIVSNIIDGEQIEVGTMDIIKQITLNYTHMTRGGIGSETNENVAGIVGARNSLTAAFG